MVMHAKKFPRLADGVTDRVAAVQFEDKTMNTSHTVHETHNDKRLDVEKRSCDGNVDFHSASPADYQHKVFHSVRTTERERQNTHRNRNSRNCSVEVENQKQKDYKVEVHRLAENICGDWSEHISSTGKRYYYNCRTEISQWEKPKDWNNLYMTSSAGYNSQFSSREKPSTSKEQNEDDNLELINVEASHVRKGELLLGDESAESRLAHVSHCAATSGSVSLVASTSTAAEQHSIRDCTCVQNTFLVSPARLAHCLPNSAVCNVVSSTAHVEKTKKQHGTSRDSDRQQVEGEDMDISPAGTAPEELRLAEQTCATSVPSDQHSADSSTTVGTFAEDSTSNSTFLNTLAKLQQALQQVTADKLSSENSSKAVPSSVLSLLATLPSLIFKLKSAGEPRASQSQPVDQHQITVQVIQMLQKLQQMLVAQQQQQQQRQLHELLLQLLAVHKLGTSDNISPPLTAGQQESPSHIKQHVDQVESPYSPPDSDGTPLGSPSEQRLSSRTADCSLVLPAGEGHNQTPNNHLKESEYVTKPSSASPIRRCTSSPASSLSTSVSHLGAVAAVNRKLDSVGLTPTLSNYVNTQLMDHIAGWQTDIAERQANCYAEESYSLSSLHCAEVSVDLKRARSLVRVNEIQSTLQEQRVMFMRQHTRDLEALRTSNSYYNNMPTDT